MACRQPQASASWSKHGGAHHSPWNALMDRTRQVKSAFGQVRQPGPARCKLASIWTMPSISPAVLVQAGPVQSVMCQFWVSAKASFLQAWDASLPGSSYPGRTTESESVPNLLGRQHRSSTTRLCVPMSYSSPALGILVATSPSPSTLLSAAAPVPLSVRGASTMCVPHAEL